MKASTMAHHSVHTLLRSLVSVPKAIDQFWSGVWWLQIRRWLQERKMAKILEESGEESIAARPVTEQYRWLERSIHYWRPSPPLVQAALEASERAGVPVSDLRLLALNREVRQVGSTVQVTRDWWILVLAYPLLILVLCYWTLFSALAVFSTVPWLAKIVGISLITLVYWFLGVGLCLYTTRPYAAARRSGAAIERAALSQLPSTATIYPINASTTDSSR